MAAPRTRTRCPGARTVGRGPAAAGPAHCEPDLGVCGAPRRNMGDQTDEADFLPCSTMSAALAKGRRGVGGRCHRDGSQGPARKAAGVVIDDAAVTPEIRDGPRSGAGTARSIWKITKGVRSSTSW